jgi:type VI secretion system protein ImpK
VITGHTDNKPIRTARFPSNWELSTERAKSVMKVMAASMQDPARLRAEGMADSDPVAANDTEDNRRKNRRVMVILKVAG